MHAALLTVLVIAGANPPALADAGRSAVVPAAMASSSGCSECAGAGCADCSSGAVGYSDGYVGGSWCRDWWGPMPQTCYNPRFGCYAGTGRTMPRYPAFHGYYYRKPYNYRHYYEYPWHASPHAPQAFFTYGESMEGQEMIMPTPEVEIAPTTPAKMSIPRKPMPQADSTQRYTHLHSTEMR